MAPRSYEMADQETNNIGRSGPKRHRTVGENRPKNWTLSFGVVIPRQGWKKFINQKTLHCTA